MLRVARGGTNWFLAPLTLAIVMAGTSGWFDAPVLLNLSPLPFFVALLMLWFFRDPDRGVVAAADEGRALVSPADGKVVRVDTVQDPDLGLADRLAVFMRVSDVHVNRAPVAGDVRRLTHTKGRHLPAFSKDAEGNERVTTLYATALGDVKVVQIAGAVARRIVPYVAAGDHVAVGDRIGLIRLGSRCDVLVPAGRVEWTVAVGDKVRGGASLIADVARGGDA